MTSFDWSFTQDPKWIEERENYWDEYVELHSYSSTRREMELKREYFFTGMRPKKGKIHQDAFVWLCPSFTEEALAYVFSNYVKEAKVLPQNFIWYQTIFFLSLSNWPGTNREDKLNLFKMVYGDSYEPSRKFPFLIGKEKEYRPITMTANDMMYGLTGGLCDAIYGARASHAVYLGLIDYWFSVIPYADSWIFSRELTDEQAKIVGSYQNRLCTISERLQKIFKSIFQSSEYMLQAEDLTLVNQNIEKIRTLLDDLSAPTELVEHWRWAKQEYGHE